MEALMAEGQGPKECSVIVCTSSENPSDKLKSQEFQSIKGYIVKPINKSDIADLTKTIRT
jgi:CheY-like chemotaxis protein